MGRKNFRLSLCCLSIIFGLSSCGQSLSETNFSDSCAPPQLSTNAGDTGFANVFSPDPIVSSGDLSLTPKGVNFDLYRTQVKLENLTGEGILKGKYVEVGNGLVCGGQFSAFETKNQFSYSHNDNRFQESMVYYYGDRYQEQIDQAGYLMTTRPTHIIAHCELDDNAFFMRKVGIGEESEQLVCLGDSVSSPGAYYSDDAVVTLHELQHGTTGDNYSMSQDLNQFWYDEAGALNESISDFMSLMFTESYIPASSAVDTRVFSRWALGTFDPEENNTRGAHRCPTYDSRYPECDQFPKFQIANPENGNQSSISYIYPDGVGWPFPNNFKKQNAALGVFESFTSQEEIHNSGMVILGGLWDAYMNLKKINPGNDAKVKRGMIQLVLESLRHLPSPNSRTNHSPVTFVGFASNLVTYADSIPEFTPEDKQAISDALKSRGLFGFIPVDSPQWMGIAAGVNQRIKHSTTPGVFVIDDPMILQRWLLRMGGKPSIVKQNAASANAKLDPGDTAAIWFDIENESDITAGGVLITASSKDPDLVFLDGSTNIGYMTLSGESQAQIMYSKINGKNIVKALNPPGAGSGIPLGNSYFMTNPFFNKTWRTALWVRVSAEAQHGKMIKIQVQATPSNGVTSVKEFPVVIN